MQIGDLSERFWSFAGRRPAALGGLESFCQDIFGPVSRSTVTRV